jgi:hypothetical protein
MKMTVTKCKLQIGYSSQPIICFVEICSNIFCMDTYACTKEFVVSFFFDQLMVSSKAIAVKVMPTTLLL